jgi:hypothetical protein
LIGNIIIIIKEQLFPVLERAQRIEQLEANYTIERHKELVKNELQERDYNEGIYF